MRVGCLVFCVGYRNPGVLCKAAVTIDHLSGGRVELGLGAGWNENEFRAFGMPFLPIKDRLDHVLDAVVDSGDCGTEPTTVIDFSDGEAEIVRRGAGDTTRFE